jgi:hypothetical protein
MNLRTNRMLRSVLTMLLLGVAWTLFPGTASAAVSASSMYGVAPKAIANDVADHCNNYGWHVVQEEWISPTGAPTATTTTVAYGAANVSLQLNYITYRCKDQASGNVVSGSTIIDSTNPRIASLNGKYFDLQYVGAKTYGYKTGSLTTFNYPGPFTKAATIKLSDTNRGTVTKSNGNDYCAVVNTEPQVSTTGPHNFAPQPGYCKEDSSSFSFNIQVGPKPIDWSLSGSTTVSATTALAGSSVTFTHKISNAGPDTATGIKWDYASIHEPVGQTTLTANSVGSSSPVNIAKDSSNPGAYKHVYPIPLKTPAGTKICEEVQYEQASGPGTLADHGSQACVTVSVTSGSPSYDISCAPDTASFNVSFSYSNLPSAGVVVKRGNGTAAASGAGTSGSGGFADGVHSAGAAETYTLYNGAAALKSSGICTIKGTPSGNFKVTGGTSITIDDDQKPAPYTSTGSFRINTAVTPTPNPNLNCSLSITKNGTPLGPGTNCSGPAAVGTDIPVTGPTGTDMVTAGDIYCSTLVVSPGSGTLHPDGTINPAGGPVSSQSCQTVTNKPFFKVFNNSVGVGGIVGECTSSAGTGTLSSWFNNTKPSAQYGASAQLGAYSLAHIAGFASDQTDGARPATGLTFANIGSIPNFITSDTPSPYLGGLVNGTNCITSPASKPDMGTINQSSFSDTVAGLASGTGSKAYSYTHDLTLAGGTIAPGQNLGVYVTGDVYITGNSISYANASGGWTINTIPSFVLSVKGNIYIAPSVTELDGSYQATGKIYTCASGLRAPIVAGALYSGCNAQLTIHGSLLASQINLLRTFGSLRDESNGVPGGCDNNGGVSVDATRATCAAEVFDFSPEAYLSQPAMHTPGGGALRYDSITSLPPVF